jgi:hypothetical protein
MSITVIKEGNVLRVLEATAPIPDGARLVLYTPEELTASRPSAWEAAQIDSVFREDDEDWGSSLDALVRKP